MTENNSSPDSTPLTTPVADSPAISASENRAPLVTPKRSRKRTLLIAGGSVLAAAVLAGGGIAVGAAIADEMDENDGDRSSASTTSEDDADDSSASGGAATDIGTDSADELNEIIAAASASAEGDAVGMEANSDGSWDVSFEKGTGEETDVRVTADGSAEVVATDAADGDDSAPLGVLDPETIDALVAAAMADVDGRITDLEIDDDPASPFAISVVQANGRTLDLDLDAEMKVLSINTD